MKEFFKRLWEGWKKVAHAIGVFQTRLFLTVFYYVLLFPFGAAVRLFMDPLQTKNRERASGWMPRDTRDRDIERLRRQS